MSPVEKGFKVFEVFAVLDLYWSKYETVGEVETVFLGDEPKPVFSKAWVKFEIGCGIDISIGGLVSDTFVAVVCSWLIGSLVEANLRKRRHGGFYKRLTAT